MSPALEYAGLGLRVVPLKPRTKVPAIVHWRDLATTEPRVIREWLTKWPDANIGIITGECLAIIDIDPGRGGAESFARLTDGRDLPRTAEASTGGGGRHVCLRVPTPVGCLTNILPGLDIKGTGGLIVVYPSIHPRTGLRYSWTHHPCEGVADAPAWLVDFLTAERAPSIATACPTGQWRGRPGVGIVGDAEKLLGELIGRFSVPGVGNRNDRGSGAVIDWGELLLGRGRDTSWP